MEKLRLAILCAFCLGASVTLALPDLSALPREVLNSALNAAINDLVREVRGRSIPDYSGSTKAFNYWLTSNQISSVTRGVANVTAHSASFVTLHAKDFGAVISGKWRYKRRRGLIRFGDSGSYTATGRRIEIKTMIGISADHSGRVSLSVRTCHASVGYLKGKVSGSWLRWLYNLILKRRVTTLKNTIGSKFCSRLPPLIARAARRIPFLH